MNLEPNGLADRDRHQRDLQITPGPRDGAIGRIRDSRLLEIKGIWLRAVIDNFHTSEYVSAAGTLA